MSQANCDYVLSHNPEVGIRQAEAEKTGRRVVEVCPNSLEIVDKSVDHELRMSIREKYGIPLHQKIFVYGGNLGKPQGIPFLMECLRKCRDMVTVLKHARPALITCLPIIMFIELMQEPWLPMKSPRKFWRDLDL